jgi:hypothetical protein
VLNGNPIHGGGGQNLSGNGFTHGAGCDCALCRAAASGVQQQQVVMPTVVKETESPASAVTASQAPALNPLRRPESQPVTEVFLSAPLGQADTVVAPTVAAEDLTVTVSPVIAPVTPEPADSVAGADLRGPSWSQACEACFSQEAELAKGVEGGASPSSPAEGLANAINPSASAGMVLLLGSFWSAQAEKSDRSLRRLFGL